MTSSNRLLRSVSLSVLAVAACAVPVYAGFEWTPPVKKEPAQVMPAAPVGTVTPEPITEAPQPAPEAEEEVAPKTEADAAPQALDAPAEKPVMLDMPAEEEGTVVETPDMAMPEAEEETQTQYPNKAIQDMMARQAEADAQAENPENTQPEPEAEAPQEPEIVEQPPVMPEVEAPAEDPVITIDMDAQDAEMPEAEQAEEMIEQVEEEAEAAEPVQELVIDPNPEIEAEAEPEMQAPALEETAPIEEMEAPTEIEPQGQGADLEINPFPEVEESAVTEESAEAPSEAIFWSEPETFDVIEGFGSDMPLALALRQIVPAQYAFSFGDGINAGTIVSWEGGKPWNEVLGSALSDKGMSYTIQGKTVVLFMNSQDAAQKKTEESAVNEESAKNAALKAELAEIEQLAAEKLEEQNNQMAADAVQDAEPEFIEAIPETEAPVNKDVSELTQDDIEAVAEEELALEDTDADGELSVVDEAASEPAPVAADEPAISKDDITWVMQAQEDAHDQSSDITKPVAVLESESLKGAAEEEISQAPTMLEENTAPAEITEDVTAPIAEAQDAPLVEEPAKAEVQEAIADEPVSPKRISIQDPGPVEAEQPEIAEEALAGAAEASVAANTQPVIIEDQITEQQPEAEDILEQNTPPTKEADFIEVEEVAVAELPVQAIPETTQDAPAVEYTEDKALDVPVDSFAKAPSNIIRVWQAKKGADLEKTLKDWSGQENIKFIWNADKDYNLSKDVFISGTFENAVNVLFSRGLETPPIHSLNKDTAYELTITGRP